MKSFLIHFSLLLFLVSCDSNDTPLPISRYTLSLLSEKIIYDNDNHAAFTGMVEYNGTLYLAFREGVNHASLTEDQYGTITILKKDGDQWVKAWELSHDNMDLRDPFLIVVNGKLRLYSGFNNFDGPNHSYQHSGTAYSDLTKDGWTELTPVTNDAPHIVWIWKIREYGGNYYGVGYLEGYKPLLMTSVDGIDWTTVSELQVEGVVSEADLCFLNDSLFICLRKDEPEGALSYWGVSRYPFKDVNWRVMEKSLACPEFFCMADTKQMWISCREYALGDDGKVSDIRVPVYSVSRDGGLSLVTNVNTKGVWDKGYPSFCLSGGTLYLSFYQRSDTDYGKSVIHLAEFSLVREN